MHSDDFEVAAGAPGLAPGPGEGACGKPGEHAEGPAEEGASHPPRGPERPPH